MLRPLLTLAVLALSALLVAPTVASVHDDVTNLHIHRELPHLWKWTDVRPPDSILPHCNDDGERPTVVTVTSWPTHIEKGQPFNVGGRVVGSDGGGLGGLAIDVYLNATKQAPGEFVGSTFSHEDGSWRLNAAIPHELQAKHYHLVAKSERVVRNCIVFREGWSDPEMDVTARTNMTLIVPPRLMIGRPVTLGGELLDNVGGPVRDAPVHVVIGNESFDPMTDAEGHFSFSYTPKRPGPLTVVGTYGGNAYYLKGESSASSTVLEEGLFLDQASDAPLQLTRSVPMMLSGQVFLPPGRANGNVTLAFQGILVHGCVGCPANSSIPVQPDKDGVFHTFLLADASQTAGAFTLVGAGGGLRNATAFNGTLVIPVVLQLDAHGSLLTHHVTGGARLLDDRGAIVNGTVGVTLAGSTTWIAPGTTYALDAPCGSASVVGAYNGTQLLLPAKAATPVKVCPALAALAPLGIVPWWAWILLVALPLAAWYAWRRWRDATAETIARGPPMRLAFTSPDDEARGTVGVGEPAAVMAYLEEPLPAKHRLRLGPRGSQQDAEVGPDLRAGYEIVPEKRGTIPILAEIVDARGRVVSRRTAHLHVVRYAEDIERRYRELKRAAVGAAEDHVSPREFEAWLHEHAHALDPAVAARLVDVFEEADYSPRDAGRAELLAYLAAQNATQEVVEAAR